MCKRKAICGLVLAGVVFCGIQAGNACTPPPVADLAAEPNETVIGVTVTFDGSSSYATGKTIVKYEWDFDGDGTYDYYETADEHSDGLFNGITTHAYTSGGTFTAKLRVTDNKDLTGIDICTVHIQTRYYVKTDGDDSSDGLSWTTAFKTIKKAVNTANDGTPNNYDVIDVNSGTYVTDPIVFINNSLRILFEEDVVIIADANSFTVQDFPYDYIGDCLFELNDRQNIEFQGNGTIFKMRKSDYMNEPNGPGHGRHVIALYGSDNISISDVTLRDSGGDGIIIGNYNGTGISHNISIRNVKCDNNVRNGISILGADQLTIENCEIKNTYGHSPQAGIDIEPCPWNDLNDIKICNTVISDNNQFGLLVALFDAPSDMVVDIFVEDVYIGNSKYGFYTFKNGQYDNGPGGLVKLKNVTIEKSETLGAGIWKSSYTDGSTPTLVFENCVWIDSGDQAIEFRGYIDYDEIELNGGVQFDNCQVFENCNRPAIRSVWDIAAGKEDLYEVHGQIYVKNNKRVPSDPCDPDDPNCLFDWNGADTNNVTISVIPGVADFANAYNRTRNKWYSTIQSGINDANANEIIEVSPGTHNETLNFGGKAVSVCSFDPNDWEVVAGTIINANGGTAAVTFNSGESSGAVLQGITLTGGTYGISCSGSSHPTIKQCIIRDNSSYGLYSSSSTPLTIKSCIVYDNDTGIELDSANSAAMVCNNTIVYNTSYGIRKSSGTEPNISNCIIWDCNDDLYGCNATYSCIQDGDLGTGNISSDPCFVDADANDFHLYVNSPCIDVGDPDGNYSGQKDIDGDNRVIDISGKGDSVNDVDMGADEYYDD